MLVGKIKLIDKLHKIKIPGRFGKSVVGAKSLKQNIPDAQKVKKISKKMDKAINKKHQVGRPILPEYDGKTTHGILITPDGKQIPFSSGNANPNYKNYIPASHVEGKAAIYMRENNIKKGTVYHNNTDGTCPYCDKMLPTLLEEGSVLEVVPPKGSVAPKPSWVDKPKTYTGNDKIPKPNK